MSSGSIGLSWFLSRTQTILFSHQIPQTRLIISNLSEDAEYVETRHIFAQWINDILAKFETRYPNILTCNLHPDLFYDPRVRSFYILLANDVHALLYAVKRKMSYTQKTLSNKVYNEMEQIQISWTIIFHWFVHTSASYMLSPQCTVD